MSGAEKRQRELDAVRGELKSLRLRREREEAEVRALMDAVVEENREAFRALAQ